MPRGWRCLPLAGSTTKVRGELSVRSASRALKERARVAADGGDEREVVALGRWRDNETAA